MPINAHEQFATCVDVGNVQTTTYRIRRTHQQQLRDPIALLSNGPNPCSRPGQLLQEGRVGATAHLEAVKIELFVRSVDPIIVKAKANQQAVGPD